MSGTPRAFPSIAAVSMYAVCSYVYGPLTSINDRTTSLRWCGTCTERRRRWHEYKVESMHAKIKNACWKSKGYTGICNQEWLYNHVKSHTNTHTGRLLSSLEVNNIIPSPSQQQLLVWRAKRLTSMTLWRWRDKSPHWKDECVWRSESIRITKGQEERKYILLRHKIRWRGS